MRLTRTCFLHLAIAAALVLPAASAATFGRVVSIGGHASDIALDEARGVLYIANYTSSRVDVMSLGDNKVARSISVPPYPGALALSPDGRFLVVTHYAAGAGELLKPAGRDSVTVIDFDSEERKTYSLPSSPVGVAFRADGRALILTGLEFLLLEPETGMTTVVETIGALGAKLPVPLATFPPQITMGSLTATPDGRIIYGIASVDGADAPAGSAFLRFSYAGGHLTAAQVLSAAPQMGPRVMSVSKDGRYYFTGWGLFGCVPGVQVDCSTAASPLVAQWPNVSGRLNVGSSAIRSSKQLIYFQNPQRGPIPPATNSQTACLPNGVCVEIGGPPSSVPAAAQTTVPPTLLIVDADNLKLQDRIQIPENLAGRSVFNSDESVLYSISDSGVTIFSMALLDKAPRVLARDEDVLFRGDFCAKGALTQELEIYDPFGNATPFQICMAGSTDCVLPTGVTISPSSGITPARVKITVDPTVLGTIRGTRAHSLELRSVEAINMPPTPSRGRTETYSANARSRFRILINNRVPENVGAFYNVPGELFDVLADPVRNRFYVLRLDKNEVQVYDAKTYERIKVLRTSMTPTQMAITLDGRLLLVGHNDSQLAYRYDLETLERGDPIVFPLGHYPKSIAASGTAVLAASRVAGPPHTIDLVDLAQSTAMPLPSLGPYKNEIHVTTTLTASPNGASILAAAADGNLFLYSAAADSVVLSRRDFTALKGSFAASGYNSFMVDHYLFNGSLVQIAPVVTNGDSSSGFAFIGEDGVSTGVRPSGEGYVHRFLSASVFVEPVGQAAGPQKLPVSTVEAALIGESDYPFTRTLAPLSSQSAIISLTTSGFTVLPWTFEAPAAPPVLQSVVNAADFSSGIGMGGLISVFGSRLSGVTAASGGLPLPTVLGDSCLTVNGIVMPMLFASPSQINAQLPLRVTGSAAVVLHAPSGVSDALNISILPAAPSVFHSGVAGPMTGLATVYRARNQALVTVSNPIHPEDRITIYLTGMGRTSPEVESGTPSPSDPPAQAVMMPSVTLGGAPLQVLFAGLTPGTAGVYQIDAAVPFKGIPTGFNIPLTITQDSFSSTVLVRVVD